MAGTLRQAMVFLGLADDGYEPQREREGRVDDDRSARREDRYDSVATGEHEVLDMEPVREDARSSRRGSAALEDFAAFDVGSPRRDQGLTEDEGDFDREPSAGVAGSHAAGLAEEADAESARGGRDLEPVRRSAPVRRDAEASANGHPDGRGARRAERRAESGASRRTASPRAEESETAPRTQGFRAPVTPINRAAAQIESDNELRRITTIHPRSYNDAKAIGESFRDNIPVIMNVTDMDVAEAKRLVDFSSGLTFALNGSIERVTEQVFLLTPANLEVLGAEETESAPRTDTGLPVFNQD